MVDILLVEDNKELYQLISKFLVKEGYTIFCVENSIGVSDFFKNNSAKLMLLDIMLPGEDGFDICGKIRKENNIPIIFISALVDKDTKMKSYLLGADDYIEKPIDIDILTAKIAALFKRHYGSVGNETVITSGAIKINRETMEVWFNENKIRLTIKEYDLLNLFIENKGKILTKEYLFSNIWGLESDSENQTLTVHIKMLRDKVEEDPKNPARIKTVWGTGYRYEEV